MALIVTGGGITDIRGPFGGVYFTRDKSGLHCSAKPRRVDQGTPKQQKQRAAFIAARALSKDNRIVSYLMYRYMNGLSILYPPQWLTPTDVSNLFPPTWQDIAFSIDDSVPPELTYAEEINVHSDDATYLVFQLQPHICDKVRFHVDSQITSGRHMSIDIYYSETWHNIYSVFAFPRLVWHELEFAEVLVSQARLRIDTVQWVRCHEFDFHSSVNPIDGSRHYPVPADYQIPKL